jgi:ribonuclease HII
MWTFENQARTGGFFSVAGVDEAGRGPLAGPVVSAAVILPESLPVSGINDSKKLTPRKRETLYHEIRRHAVAVGVGIVDPAEIDRINILNASLAAMAIAVENLPHPPDFLLIDGQFGISLNLPQQAIVKGDSKSVSIAAASIIAKVTRDRIMDAYGKQYPEFDFAANKGYPTKSHQEAIKKFGCCPIHRRTFKGVREYLSLR